MSGHWIVYWPEYEPTGRPGDSLVASPAATWVITRELTQAEIQQYLDAGASLRYVPAPEEYTPPPEKPPPDTKVDDEPRESTPVEGEAAAHEIEHDEGDDGKEIEVSVEYEDEEGDAKTVNIQYTYEHVKASGVIGAGAHLVIDSGGLYKMSTDGAVLEGEVVMTDALQELFDTTHIDGAGNVYGTTYIDPDYYLTKNGDLVTAIMLDYFEGDIVGYPVADFDGNVFVGNYWGRLTLVSSAGDTVWEKHLGLAKHSAPWFGCVGGDHCYFTDGVP